MKPGPLYCFVFGNNRRAFSPLFRFAVNLWLIAARFSRLLSRSIVKILKVPRITIGNECDVTFRIRHAPIGIAALV